MCALNPLKKRLHLTKLIKFINKHNYLLFYQCHTLTGEKKTDVFPPSVKLFLTSLPGLRRLSLVENTHLPLELGNPNRVARIEQLLTVSADGYLAMGNTLLVGCDKLDTMQECIKRGTTSKHSYLCIGAIYENKFVNGVDCIRLSNIKPFLVQSGLLNVVSLPAIQMYQQIKENYITFNTLLFLNSKTKLTV